MYRIEKWKKSRFWGVFDRAGKLVCLCVYKRGAQDLCKRLEGGQP
jgi:hypothetical protein